MKYDHDEWTLIVSEIERQGGAMLPEYCVGEVIKFTSPNATRVTKVHTCNCHTAGDPRQSMFVAIYDPADDDKEANAMRSKGAGFVRACLRCDNAGSWPRFEHYADELEED